MDNGFVEKWWKSLRESRWVSCGKNCEKMWKNKFCTKLSVILHIMFGFVERFAGGFAHRNNGYGGVVLHIFHIVYYYSY